MAPSTLKQDPNTGQENNIVQPQRAKNSLAFHFIFYRLAGV